MHNRRSKKVITRRTMLQLAGLGGTSLAALPFLSRMRSAHAGGESIRRLIIVTAPNEALGRDQWAVGSLGQTGVPITSLASSVMEPIEPYKDRLRIIGDLTNQAILDKNWHADSSHFGIMWMLNGVPTIPFSATSEKGDEWAGGPTIDHYISDALGYGSPLVVAAGLHQTSGTAAHVSFPAAMEMTSPLLAPQDSFASVFGGFEVPEDQFARLAAQRSSVVDVVAGDLAALSNRLPSADRVRLDHHLTQIRELEQNLNTLGVPACSELPLAPDDVDSNAANQIPENSRRQIDVVVQALACDLQRVVTLQYGGNGTLYPKTAYNWPDEQWPAGGLSTSDEVHELAHGYDQGNGPLAGERLDMETWHYGQLRYLLDKLSETVESNGKTLLDSTLVMFVHPMGWRHKQDTHLHLFAGGDDFITTGQFDSHPGVPHNRILAGVCRAMGVDVQGYGDPDYDGYIDLA